MTVIDSSGVVDFLLGEDAGPAVQDLLSSQLALVAPDLIVFEVLAVIRRLTLRGAIRAPRAERAIADFGDAAIDLFPSMGLRDRAWELRDNFTVADALFVALAESLEEPLATKDRRLLKAVATHTDVDTIDLAA